jgi:acid phosphatase (class A)
MTFASLSAFAGTIGSFPPAFNPPPLRSRSFPPLAPLPPLETFLCGTQSASQTLGPILRAAPATDELSLNLSQKIFPPGENVKLKNPPRYLASQHITPSAIIHPPPLRDSPAYKKDFEVLQELERIRTPADVTRAKELEEHDLDWHTFRGPDTPFLDSPEFRDGIARLFVPKQSGAQQDLWMVARALKEYFHRQRPTYEEPLALAPAAKKDPDSWAYPSTHTTLAYGLATMLTALDPSTAADPQKYYRKAAAIALDREILGVHHPSDIAAGVRAGQWVAQQILASPAFQQDVAAARAQGAAPARNPFAKPFNNETPQSRPLN